MSEVIHVRAADIESAHRNDHEGYEYYRRALIPAGAAKDCTAAMYEIPPGKSAYPYHYHIKNEESFYILSGEGVLKTPQGTKTVAAGDFLFFPTGESGAHKLTNTSETETLVYLDFDTFNDPEVAFYPDSNKIGVYGRNVRQIYRTGDQADYYEGE